MRSARLPKRARNSPIRTLRFQEARLPCFARWAAAGSKAPEAQMVKNRNRWWHPHRDAFAFAGLGFAITSAALLWDVLATPV